MCVILYFSSLPFLVSPKYYVLGYGFAFSFVEFVTFLGSVVVSYTDAKYVILQMCSIVLYAIGFAVDKARGGVLS